MSRQDTPAIELSWMPHQLGVRNHDEDCIDGHDNTATAPPADRVHLSRRLACQNREDTATSEAAIQLFQYRAHASYMHGVPQVSHLPALVQFNVMTALARNAELLGFSKEYLNYDAISTFNKQGPMLGLTVNASNWPASLHPTPLQALLEHHPWIDLFPLPRMRDNFLRAIQDPDICDEDVLCHDLAHFDDVAGKATLIVWGDAWDSRCWEASEAFLEKWGWLLFGCPEIFQATNYWRDRRGEGRLSPQQISAYMERSRPAQLLAIRPTQE
ncbi:hypothetical protein PLICBS_008927 [Purpureocillium lilacinum]|uniref:uncharacterized protein n=1 Tax=Purpureocillium lilacinum TaxID=33203 RepID=UPI00208B807C|nr:hypothetical protein PLICBS_008927 [Purpureocillium lilacinum]